jgi:hypothetical protein
MKQPPPEKPLTVLKDSRFDKGPDHDTMRKVYDDANASTLRGIQRWLIFGQMLLEKKEALGHGPYEAYRAEKWPDLEERKARRLTQCIKNIKTLLPALALNLPVSAVLLADDKDLAGDALKYKQDWRALTEGKKFKDFLAGDKYFEDAVNGIALGGNPDNADAPDRKAYDVFAEHKFKLLTSFFTVKKAGKPYKFRNITKLQQAKIVNALCAESEFWPRWLLEPAILKWKDELKRDDAARLAHHNAE